MKQEIIQSEDKLLQASKDSDIKILEEFIYNDLIFNDNTAIVSTLVHLKESFMHRNYIFL